MDIIKLHLCCFLYFQVISSQYKCTIHAVLHTTCNGGIIDTWRAIYHTIGSASLFGYSCR